MNTEPKSITIRKEKIGIIKGDDECLVTIAN